MTFLYRCGDNYYVKKIAIAIQSESQSDNMKLCKISTEISFYASAILFQKNALSSYCTYKKCYCIKNITKEKND